MSTGTILSGMLMYFLLPLWLAAGFADYLCHRATAIERTSGWVGGGVAPFAVCLDGGAGAGRVVPRNHVCGPPSDDRLSHPARGRRDMGRELCVQEARS